ncbi:GlxA family transcriptional regulator [Yunchengibacter salinarum]|uniref:GlxA family transcriptional regulator n=1 Tax=Yunchengibacter salinarum TaxID=3133399 RepID=UPI0035B64849
MTRAARGTPGIRPGAAATTAPGRTGAGESGCALSVVFVPLPNFTLTPFANFIDMLRLATDDGDNSRQTRCRWHVASADGSPVRASCGTQVGADIRLDALDTQDASMDYVVVVGGLLRDDSRPDPHTDAFLLDAANRGRTIVGLCTAVFTLLRLGLLSGRRCCVSWFHLTDLKDAFPDITPIADQLFVVDGPRITCAGGTAAIDLAAHLLRRHLDHSVADKALHILLADRARPPHAPQPHSAPDRTARDARLKKAVRLIDEALARQETMGALAERLGLSRRQMERLFRIELGTTPAAFRLERRLRQGHWLLTRSDRSVTDIAHACGFADLSHFSRHMRRAFGASPQTIRAATRQPPALTG